MLKICAWRRALVEASRMIRPSQPLLGRVKLKRKIFELAFQNFLISQVASRIFPLHQSPSSVMCENTLYIRNGIKPSEYNVSDKNLMLSGSFRLLEGIQAIPLKKAPSQQQRVRGKSFFPGFSNIVRLGLVFGL